MEPKNKSQRKRRKMLRTQRGGCTHVWVLRITEFSPLMLKYIFSTRICVSSSPTQFLTGQCLYTQHSLQDFRVIQSTAQDLLNWNWSWAQLGLIASRSPELHRRIKSRSLAVVEKIWSCASQSSCFLLIRKEGGGRVGKKRKEKSRQRISACLILRVMACMDVFIVSQR